MSVRIVTNRPRIAARIAAGRKRMTAALTEQVITDSNYFCRQDQGMLISSSLSASQPDKGLAIWDTKYAKRVYYTGTPSKDVNANAALMWCEKAKMTFGSDWLLIANKALKEGMA